MKLSILLFASICSIGNGFIFEKPLAPLKNLNQLVDAQSDHRLSVSLDIGKPGDTSRLAINNLVFDLSEHAPTSNDQHIKMPGAHGPQPSLSGGIRRLTTIQNGSFISMNGCEVVNAIKGCWEIIWKKDAPAGSLIAGFELDKTYQRNAAKLEEGELYISFNTWSKEGLEHAQEEKRKSSKIVNDAENKKDDAIAKMKETNNLVERAILYFNALSAAEVYSKQPIQTMKLVPSTSDEIIPLEGMYVSMNGNVWKKDPKSDRPIILGVAKLNSVPKEE